MREIAIESVLNSEKNAWAVIKEDFGNEILRKMVWGFSKEVVSEEIRTQSDQCLAIVERRSIGDTGQEFAKQFFNKLIKDLSAEAVSECLREASNQIFVDLVAENVVFDRIFPVIIKKFATEISRDFLLEALADDLIGGVVDEVKTSFAKIAYLEGHQSHHMEIQTRLFSGWVDGLTDEALVELLVDDLGQPNLEAKADMAVEKGCQTVDKKWLDDFYFS